jgi:hypothetical protein
MKKCNTLAAARCQRAATTCGQNTGGEKNEFSFSSAHIYRTHIYIQKMGRVFDVVLAIFFFLMA